jgi:hypothetical protein
MPRPTPLPLRQALLRQAQAGLTPTAIAAALGLPVRTVRHFLQRFRHQPDASLVPKYRQPKPPISDPVCEAALQLRRLHPTWGAPFIRLHLEDLLPDASLPTPRTLQRWLRQADLQPAPKGRPRSAQTYHRAQHCHDVWQVDAADHVALHQGRLVSWLRLVDESSGAILATVVFPPGVLEFGAGHRRASRVASSLPPLGTSPPASFR